MIHHLRTCSIALAAVVAGCAQSQPFRVDATATCIPGHDAVQIDVRTCHDGSVVQMPQITVNVGGLGTIRTGTPDDAGAFTGWVGECSVESDKTLIEWAIYERGVRGESGLSIVENK